jgi:hypothetical protein
MDLQIYYRKIREIERNLSTPSVVVASHDTPDGGREGVFTEVSRRTGAKMIVEGSARLATEEEASAFRERNVEAKSRADQLAAATRMQFTVVSTSDLRKLKGSTRSGGE